MFARWSYRLWVLTLLLVVAQSAAAQDQAVRFSLGVAGVAVADAWNPLRLEVRDLPNATLTLFIDQGTLRSGEVPLTITRAVRGGAGITVFEFDFYLPTFTSLSWRLATPERVIASGSVAGRESDARPLDLLLTNDPAAYRAAYGEVFGASGRQVEVPSADLPEGATAYDGVRSLVIDGSASAPRLEAVAAAAAGGVIVALRGELPASHHDLQLLLEPSGAPTRLGAGVLFSGAQGTTALLQQVAALSASVPNRPTLLAAALERPLVEPPTPLPQAVVLLVGGVLSLLLLLLLRWAGAPGIITALALVALVSVWGWQLLRPNEPQISGELSLLLVGGELALELPALETLTLPQARLTFPSAAHPMRLQPYEIGDDGAHIVLGRWRAVLLLLAPRLSTSQLVWDGSAVRNVGSETVHDLYRVNHGLLGPLQPGATTGPLVSAGAPDTRVESVGGGLPLDGESHWPGYDGLLEQLPSGAVLARSRCLTACQVWVLYPEASFAGEAGALERQGGPEDETDGTVSLPQAQDDSPADTANPFAPSGGSP